MSDDPAARRAEKAIALILVTVWAAVFLGLSFDQLAVSEPRFWALYTAVVWILVGKLWDLEVDKYLPGNNAESTSSENGDDR